MRTYEEMAKIVLRRIEGEKEPMWKYILKSVIRHLLLLILVLLIVGTISWLLGYLFPQVYVLLGEGCS